MYVAAVMKCPVRISAAILPPIITAAIHLILKGNEKKRRTIWFGKSIKRAVRVVMKMGIVDAYMALEPDRNKMIIVTIEEVRVE